MCGTPVIDEAHQLIVDAREVADRVLDEYLRIGIAKALDLRTARGFDQAVARIANELRRRAGHSDGAAARAAISALDVDWSNTTAEQRRRLIARALAAARQRTAGVPAQVEVVFGNHAEAVVRAGREGARRDQPLSVRADFNAVDRRVIEHLRTSPTNYVRDEYGRRHEAFSERARQIVADGLEAGLGRDDLARDLAAAATGILTGRATWYWDVVAAAFVGRGRSLAQLSAYAEAGLARYRIVAVLDEVTTPTCRFLDGKTFSVSRGIELFDRTEATPDQLNELNPWIREGRDPAGGQRSLYIRRGDERIMLARIERAGAGRRDDAGALAGVLDERELGELGIGFPPYHGLCRTTTIGVVT